MTEEPDAPPVRGSSFINRIVAASLGQRVLIVVVTILLLIAGFRAWERLPVDAYPDLSPPMVEIITQWPGHSAEEVERLITVPTEIAMNGIPKENNIRSISLYALSDVRLTLDQNTDRDFARQQVFNRLGDISLPTGVTPSVSPLASPSGLIYRYSLQSGHRLSSRHSKTGSSNRSSSPSQASPTIPVLAVAACSIRCCSIRTDWQAQV
jgi:cobalt-zinc-cadmium resistance protein CzcA